MKKPSNRKQNKRFSKDRVSQNPTQNLETSSTATNPVESTQSQPNGNHPEWYTGNDILTSSLGKLNFSTFKGSLNHLRYQKATATTNAITKIEDIDVGNRFPGIMVHLYAPMFGSLNSVGNDADEMARMVYANMRRTISGRRNYDSNAVLQYILAIGSLQAAFAELHRVLAAVRNRSITNKYFGERLVEALGYDYDELASNYNDLLAELNLLTITAQTFALPKGLALFDKWYWMGSSVFLDREDAKSGLIVFRPYGFWKFAKVASWATDRGYSTLQKDIRDLGYTDATIGTAVQTGATAQQGMASAPYGMIFESFPAAYTAGSAPLGRFKTILKLLRRTADEYSANHDFNIIASDLLKTYGDEVVAVQEFEANTALNITYDRGVVLAAKNITYVPFMPEAILEFPNISLRHQSRLKSLVYVVGWDNVNKSPLFSAITSKFDKPDHYNVQDGYIFSDEENVEPGQAMSMLKWQARYKFVNSYAEGNVVIVDKSNALSVVKDKGILLTAVGTEVIIHSQIYAIHDSFEEIKPISGGEAKRPESTRYGQQIIDYGYSNVAALPRFKSEASVQETDLPSWRTLAVSLNVLQFFTLGNQWESCPALFFMLPRGLRNALTTGNTQVSVIYGSDLMTLNPLPHFAIISVDELARHHEVAMASLLGLGRWGSSSINSERRGPGAALESGAFSK